MGEAGTGELSLGIGGLRRAQARDGGSYLTPLGPGKAG